MNILILGSEGFIGKNLVIKLKEKKYNVLTYDKGSLENLDILVDKSDFIFNTIGVNRSDNPQDFIDGNVVFHRELIKILNKNPKPLLFTSTISVDVDNIYGNSKKEAELLFKNYEKENNIPVFIYRLHNCFGKYSKPNYNSVIATWCYNASRDLPLYLDDEEKEIEFVYIDDVVEEFINCINKDSISDYYYINKRYRKKLIDIKNMIIKFKNSRNNYELFDFSDEFYKKLYSTYTSYLKEDNFTYTLITHKDDRGSFSEFLKSNSFGQISINTIKPNITKGNHYHHLKVEKFLVVSGKCLIKFTDIKTNKNIEYIVSENKLEVIDIPIGYNHTITNISDKDAVVVIWANEVFDKDNPDTYIL